ncbi:MAG: LacI family DNA-binding transcriptional regulator, partial [Myxococcales bacterium]|nr:LacI family DNA-binding transcriptional regulator [Myxococcales bacterium]
ELAQRVRDAIKKLNFHPNHLARSLMATRTKTLAFLTPDISNAAFLRIFKAVDAIACRRGYSLFLLNTDGSMEMARRALTQVMELKMDGVFFTLNWAMTQLETELGQLAERGVRMMGVAGSYAVPNVDCFLWDEEGAGEQLGRYLRRLGHREVLCVGPSRSRSAEKRWGGARRAYDDSPESVTLADTNGYTAQSGYDAMHNAIIAARPFTVVLAFNDAIATGALAALHDQGLSVPEDVSFVSFGDHHRDFSRPQITSMTFDEEKIAELAGNRLIDRIEGRLTEPADHFYLPLRLSTQPSSRKLTARDKAVRPSPGRKKPK